MAEDFAAVAAGLAEGAAVVAGLAAEAEAVADLAAESDAVEGLTEGLGRVAAGDATDPFEFVGVGGWDAASVGGEPKCDSWGGAALRDRAGVGSCWPAACFGCWSPLPFPDFVDAVDVSVRVGACWTLPWPVVDAVDAVVRVWACLTLPWPVVDADDAGVRVGAIFGLQFGSGISCFTLHCKQALSTKQVFH